MTSDRLALLMRLIAHAVVGEAARVALAAASARQKIASFIVAR